MPREKVIVELASFISIIFIISLISFFITENEIFPAYLVSVPLTIYLTQKKICSSSYFYEGWTSPILIAGMSIVAQTYWAVEVIESKGLVYTGYLALYVGLVTISMLTELYDCENKKIKKDKIENVIFFEFVGNYLIGLPLLLFIGSSLILFPIIAGMGLVFVLIN